MKNLIPLSILVAACLGCAANDGGMNASAVQSAENVNALAKSSDGDWNKLTPDQQQQMTQATGSEGTAKMVLQMKAHPPAPIAPGRPTHPGG